MSIWLPLAIDLIKEWLKEGEPKKASIERLYEEFKKLDVEDMAMLGRNMQIAGVAFEEIATNLADNETQIEPSK